MSTFKVGDKVRMIGANGGFDASNGAVGTIERLYHGHGSGGHWVVRWKDNTGGFAHSCDSQLEIVKELVVPTVKFISPFDFPLLGNFTYSNIRGTKLSSVFTDEVSNIKTTKKTLMNTVTSMMRNLLDPETQALIEAGFLGQDLELTSEGGDALDAIVFTQNKEALVKAAKAKLDAAKKK